MTTTLNGVPTLRTNLSDLAAMGAAPLGYLTTVSVPRDTPDAVEKGCPHLRESPCGGIGP